MENGIESRYAPDCIWVLCANSKFTHESCDAHAHCRPASVIARVDSVDKVEQFRLDFHRGHSHQDACSDNIQGKNSTN